MRRLANHWETVRRPTRGLIDAKLVVELRNVQYDVLTGHDPRDLAALADDSPGHDANNGNNVRWLPKWATIPTRQANSHATYGNTQGGGRVAE